MNSLFKICIFSSCLFAAASAAAQVPVKNLPQLAKASFTASKIIQGPVLSASQRKLLQVNFNALEEARRALYQNSGWVLSSNFQKTAKQLGQLGLSMPPAPKPTASAQEKENYRKEIATILYRESSALGKILDIKPRPQTPQDALSWNREQFFRSQALSRHAWAKVLQQKSPVLKWGTPNWDEVRVLPLPLSENPKSALYIPSETLQKMTEKAEQSLSELYDSILQEKTLSFFQKQTLITAINDANSLLTYDFVRLYMCTFGQIPVVVYDAGLRTPKPQDSLHRYAVELQQRLIDKLEQSGAWTPEDFELFVQSSVYLPPQQAQAVLGAVTYLEPRAASWLLTHPVDDPTSQKLIAKINWLRSQKDLIWPDGKILPKMHLGKHFDQLKYERARALHAQWTVLYNRLKKLLDKQEQIVEAAKRLKEAPAAPNSSPEQVVLDASSRIRVYAQKARLQRVIDETQNTMQQIRQELSDLWRE